VPASFTQQSTDVILSDAEIRIVRRSNSVDFVMPVNLFIMKNTSVKAVEHSLFDRTLNLATLNATEFKLSSLLTHDSII
jgi:hypothetical protein